MRSQTQAWAQSWGALTVHPVFTRPPLALPLASQAPSSSQASSLSKSLESRVLQLL